MTHIRAVIPFHHKPSNRELPQVIRGVLITNREPFGNLVDREFRYDAKKFHNLKASMIRKSLYDPL